jgi:hypothetical protein
VLPSKVAVFEWVAAAGKDDLEDLEAELGKRLVELGGSPVRPSVSYRWQYVRCGKASCACATNAEAQHGPYFYRHWWDAVKRRTRRAYVAFKDVPPDVLAKAPVQRSERGRAQVEQRTKQQELFAAPRSSR